MWLQYMFTEQYFFGLVKIKPLVLGPQRGNFIAVLLLKEENLKTFEYSLKPLWLEKI